MDTIDIALGIFLPFLLGLFLIRYGIRLRMGCHKAWYMTRWVRPWSNIYMYIPLGIMCLAWGIAGIFALLFPGEIIYVVNRIILGLGVIMIIIGMIMPFVYSDHLKPSWLRWLEQEHGDILSILRDEAKAMGYTRWENEARTQKDLELWVAEVRRKHNRPKQ